MDKRGVLQSACVWLLRLMVGALFVFSGFVKAVDPWGTIYKLQDYLAAMGLDIWSSLVVVGSFILSGGEFMLGAMILTGSFRRSAPIVALCFMAVMLPLTLWIAVSNPVNDCGCFGDAYVISNWATFWKNVVLTLAVVALVRYNRMSKCLVTPSLQWVGFVSTALYTTMISLIGYNAQPAIDFRPYKAGTELFAKTSDSEIADFVFVYEKNGRKREFSASDELPDEEDGWRFVERRPAAGSTDMTEEDSSASRLTVWSHDGTEEMSEEDLDLGEKSMVLLMPSLKEVSISTTWRINSLQSWASRHGISMIALASGSDEDFANWDDLSMPAYPVYRADDTVLKEIARGNPAVVYLENDTIRWKSSLKSIEADDFLDPSISADPMSFVKSGRELLNNLTLLYIGVMAVLIALSMIPALGRMFMRGWRFGKENGKEISHDDTAHPSE